MVEGLVWTMESWVGTKIIFSSFFPFVSLLVGVSEEGGGQKSNGLGV